MAMVTRYRSVVHGSPNNVEPRRTSRGERRQRALDGCLELGGLRDSLAGAPPYASSFA
jgi:hypothetical protein